MERDVGFEPTTCRLETYSSTTELIPLVDRNQARMHCYTRAAAFSCIRLSMTRYVYAN